VTVPWSGFDLINAFNGWKTSENAGRVFVVAPDGTTTKQVSGLSWRNQVSAQVFEEAAVDLGRGLARFAQRGDRQVGFPRRKRKGSGHDSFRLRNKRDPSGRGGIRVGEGHPRSVRFPRIGTVRVFDDTRRLRRMLRPAEHVDPHTGETVVGPRARVLSATIRRRADRWYVCLNLEAADYHRCLRHQQGQAGGRRFVGIDRGLAAFAVVADSESATSASPELSPMPPGPSSPASFGTSPPGSGANWWFASAGFPRPSPAPPADGWRRSWRWGCGSFVAVVAGWSWTGTSTPPPISPPGPRQPLSRPLRSRTAKRAAGSLMPLEGKALAIASAVAKPAPVNGEPKLQLPAEAEDTREG
jgi:hypothetical protein